MDDLWTRLKPRKRVQWARACVACSFAQLQGIDIVAQPFDWPGRMLRLAIGGRDAAPASSSTE